MNVLVTGVPRSGTTMMAGLMTALPRYAVMNEPSVNRMKHDEQRDLRCAKWGVKQVSAGKIQAALDFLPETIIIMARDLRQAGFSMHEKMVRMKTTNRQFRLSWMTESAKMMIRLCVDPRARIVSYEDFVSDPDYRQTIERTLEWPLVGDPNMMAGKTQWPYEMERHGHRVTAASLRLDRATDPEAVRFVEDLMKDRCVSELQMIYGY